MLVPDEPRDDHRVDHGLALGDSAKGVDEDDDVEDPFFEEVAAALGTILDEAHGEDRTAANEWGQHGINVNVISPTLRTDAFEAWEEDRPEFVRALREALPMRRLGDPIADGGPLAVFLASADSDHITGVTFMLNGGKLMP